MRDSKNWLPGGRNTALWLVGMSACANEALDSGVSDSALPPSSEAFVLGEVQDCPAPAATPTWENAALGWGLPGSTSEVMHTDGGGIALADFDGDGLLDLFYHYEQQAPQIWLQDDSGDLVKGPAPDLVINVGQATALDLNDDGLAEVVYAGPNLEIFYNLGEMEFESEQIGVLGETKGFGRQAIPLHANSDGLLDLFVPVSAPEEARGPEYDELQDHLLYQQADGWTTEGLPQPSRRDAFDGVPFDWQDDGDTDLYVVNDKGNVTGPNVLWQQQDGALDDASAECDCDLNISGMGGSANDVDGDGVPDLFVTAIAKNYLLQGQVDGSFVDVSAAMYANTLGFPEDMGWGSTLEDVDNDGLIDILMARGDLWYDQLTVRFESPVDLLIQGEDGRFSDEGAAFGLPREGSWRGVLAWDLNADGVLDLLLHDVEEPPQVLLSEGCTAPAWLAVDIPAGSRVRLETESGSQVRWPGHHPGYGATQPPRAWFGLGTDTVVKRLEVRLLDGTEHILYGPIDARRVISIDEGR